MGCGALSVLGLSLGLDGETAGGIMGNQAAQQTTGAMDAVANQQQALQNQLAVKELQRVNNAAMATGSQAAQQNQQTGAAQYQQASKNAGLVPATLPGNNLPTNNVSGQGQQIRNQQAQQSNAQMRGYGNVGMQQSLSNMGLGGDLSNLAAQSRIASSMYGPMMQQAQHSHQSEQSWAQLISGLGSLVAGLGVSNLGGSGSSGGSGGGSSQSPPPFDSMGISNSGSGPVTLPIQAWAPLTGGWQ